MLVRDLGSVLYIKVQALVQEFGGAQRSWAGQPNETRQCLQYSIAAPSGREGIKLKTPLWPCRCLYACPQIAEV